MATSASTPNLDTIVNAYAELEIDVKASAADVRRAYRRLARIHHPDRVPANAPDHARATARMAAINAAYHLIQDAPLRHHPISRGSDWERTFTDTQLEEALRRGRQHRRMQHVWSAVAFTGSCLVMALLALPILRGAGVSYPASALVILACAACMFTLRRTLDPFLADDLLLDVVRLFVRHM
jgi:hypothetical protein